MADLRKKKGGRGVDGWFQKVAEIWAAEWLKKAN